MSTTAGFKIVDNQNMSKRTVEIVLASESRCYRRGRCLWPIIGTVLLALTLDVAPVSAQISAAEATRRLEESTQRMREQNERNFQATQERLAQMRAEREAANERARQQQAESLARQREAAQRTADGWKETNRVVHEAVATVQQDIANRAEQERREYEARKEIRRQEEREANQAAIENAAAAPSDPASNTSERLGTSAARSGRSDPDSATSVYVGEKFPQTRTRIISDEEARAMNFAELRYAINEVYARHGADFTAKPQIRDRFSHYDWYQPRSEVSFGTIEEELSDTERANIETLAKYRDIRQDN